MSAHALQITELAPMLRQAGPIYERALVEAELRHPCGTWQAYKRGCRCDSCRAANRDYNRTHPRRKVA